MTEQKLADLVTELVALDQDIRALEAKLSDGKARLVAEASSREEEHIQTDGGGWSWARTGLDGCIARVSFPAPTLKTKVDGEGKTIEKVRAAAGRFFDRLFAPTIAYRPVADFRNQAAALIGPDARKLIKLCESESKPRVSFETKEAEP
jgi:hypothetical protein